MNYKTSSVVRKKQLNSFAFVIRLSRAEVAALGELIRALINQ